ncbi:MAG: ferritin family protein [Candidatus Saganbacteria bacterium]|nr:ferritin family protein [Candidatus Saganbacteria bacterium]
MTAMLEAMKIALDMEKKGYQVYLDAARKITNELGRATLEAIAAKELEHIQAIESYCRRPDDPAASKLLGAIKHSEKRDYIRQITERVGRELEKKSEADLGLTDAYRAALELERESYLFYQKLAQAADRPELKAFFEFLMGQENIHYELFQETLEYLDRPGDWFREQERWIVEGG